MSSVFGFAKILKKEESDILGTVYRCVDEDGHHHHFRTLQPVPVDAKLYWEWFRDGSTAWFYKTESNADWIYIATISLAF